jgi:hypothetical protein
MDRKRIYQAVLMSIVINGVIPLVVYNLLIPYTSSLTALMIATAIPLADNLIFIFKFQKIDAFAAFMLLGFVLSILAFFIGGNEKLILIRESFVTGIMGIVFLLSLLFPRPLIYHFAVKFIAGDDRSKQDSFNEGWKHSYFRFVLRLMSAVWGITLVGEAIVKVILVYQLSVSAFLAVSQLVFYSILGAAILWTVLYRGHAKRRLELIKQENAEINNQPIRT